MWLVGWVWSEGTGPDFIVSEGQMLRLSYCIGP
jgi:hypothetical protein